MTKFMEWLVAGSFVLGTWLALITNTISSSIGNEWYIVWFPIIFLFLFGLYAATVVLYRVFTFNDCEEAAIELQNQIKEATADLESKGIVLVKKNK